MAAPGSTRCHRVAARAQNQFGSSCLRPVARLRGQQSVRFSEGSFRACSGLARPPPPSPLPVEKVPMGARTWRGLSPRGRGCPLPWPEGLEQDGEEDAGAAPWQPGSNAGLGGGRFWRRMRDTRGSAGTE